MKDVEVTVIVILLLDALKINAKIHVTLNHVVIMLIVILLTMKVYADVQKDIKEIHIHRV